ncbi:MAG: response regulator transcription factor [Nesterenkonia sp.]|uniref:response regulator n=1 Tax=Nesterenkonia marinintestina TaxID=2979865 RepID=UPI0021BF73C9|nr:response regulator transcription factor [Nesterenkonia sp. GX14115]MDO5493905.1 response regulator transcription factor [Nesterenkonia sp.]
MSESSSPDTEPIRALLVDDHPVVRAGLRAMLEGSDLVVVAEAETGEEAVRLAVERQAGVSGPDLVLMDLQLGSGIDGAEATRRIRRAAPELPVLILTTYDTDADILAAVEAGAAGYMLKDAPPEQIHRAVRDAAAGRTALAPEVAARLVGRIREPSPSLSAREVQLVELLATGLSNRAIAKELFISEATVKTHLIHVYQKLGVDNRVSAVSEARARRIIRS